MGSHAFLNAVNTEALGARSSNARLPNQRISRLLAKCSSMHSWARTGQPESRILTAHKNGWSGSGRRQTALQAAMAAPQIKLHSMQSHTLPSTSVKVKGHRPLPTSSGLGFRAGIEPPAQILIVTRITLQTLSSCIFAGQSSRWRSGSWIVS